MKESFGEFVRKLRTEKQLTLTQLAAQLDMDSANLSKIETGKRDFDEKRLDKLANVFNLDLEELKMEYFSDFIAKKIYKIDNSKDTLILAEEKVNYLRIKNIKQTNLHI
jgi:transcriptional regulator with XRE-family HTH domain